MACQGGGVMMQEVLLPQLEVTDWEDWQQKEHTSFLNRSRPANSHYAVVSLKILAKDLTILL